MASERYILSRPNADKTEFIVQYPLTIADQVYDFEKGQFLDATLRDIYSNMGGAEGSPREINDGAVTMEKLSPQVIEIINRPHHLENTSTKINIKYPPNKIEGAKGDGVYDDTFTQIYGLYSLNITNSNRINVSSNMWSENKGIMKCTNCNAVSFNGNNHSQSLAGVDIPDLEFNNTSVITINNNLKFATNDAFTDGCYFEMKGTSDYLVCTGNMLDMINKNSSNWYVATGSNNLINNNLIK